MANRLQGENSLYLQQHARNPVEWHPWGSAAFARARAEDKPLLLSIGYSACHWCHVMAHESFADPEVAAVMNRHFVSVKVDREERPDVDAVYMAAVQAMTGHGGWPLTAFLTPAGVPFYGGTYFPPRARGGLPGFVDLLERIAVLWRDDREGIEAAGARLRAALGDQGGPAASETAAADLLARAAGRLAASHDRRNGGFGTAPKFPQAPALEFLLRRAAHSGDAALADLVVGALAGMASGGIHDQVGGGFHRYSVDAEWTVPHFEKMLYDNALLARLYLQAWQLTGLERLRQTATAALDFVLRELEAPEGGFFAALDADTADGEGVYYTWTAAEVAAVLPPDQAAAAREWYGVWPGGNFEGRTIPTARRDPAAVAGTLGIDEPALGARLAAARDALLRARSGRPAPAVDTKCIVACNGLAIDALARAGVALQRADYLAAARRAAERIRRASEHGVPHVIYAAGPQGSGFLDDCAAVTLAAIGLYEATAEAEWLAWARELAGAMVTDFAPPGGGPVFRTSPRHKALIVRQRDLHDGPIASGAAMAADALRRLYGLTAEDRWRAAADAALEEIAGWAAVAPTAVCGGLAVLQDDAGGRREIAIAAGSPEEAVPLAQAIYDRYLPGTVLAVGPGAGAAGVPLLADRGPIDGRAAAYVCRAHVCALPVTSPGALTAQLGATQVSTSMVLPEDPTLA